MRWTYWFGMVTNSNVSEIEFTLHGAIQRSTLSSLVWNQFKEDRMESTCLESHSNALKEITNIECHQVNQFPLPYNATPSDWIKFFELGFIQTKWILLHIIYRNEFSLIEWNLIQF